MNPDTIPIRPLKWEGDTPLIMEDPGLIASCGDISCEITKGDDADGYYSLDIYDYSMNVSHVVRGKNCDTIEEAKSAAEAYWQESARKILRQIVEATP